MDINGDLKLINSADQAAAFAAAMRLAKNGNTEVYLTLGWFFEAGHGCKKDYLQAENYYRKSFDAGVESSNYYLGRLLANNGRFNEAQKYLDSSLAKHNPSAAYWLAVSLYDQSKEKNDLDQYFKFLRIAADSGHLFAQRDLAKAYISGRFGFVNRAKGVYQFVRILGKALFVANKEDSEWLYK